MFPIKIVHNVIGKTIQHAYMVINYRYLQQQQ